MGDSEKRTPLQVFKERFPGLKGIRLVPQNGVMFAVQADLFRDKEKPIKLTLSSPTVEFGKDGCPALDEMAPMVLAILAAGLTGGQIVDSKAEYKTARQAPATERVDGFGMRADDVLFNNPYRDVYLKQLSKTPAEILAWAKGLKSDPRQLEALMAYEELNYNRPEVIGGIQELLGRPVTAAVPAKD